MSFCYLVYRVIWSKHWSLNSPVAADDHSKKLEQIILTTMRVIIKKDQSEAGRWTASYIIEKIRDSQRAGKEKFVLGLPTGSSPLPVYRELIRSHKAGEISFSNVITFNMDEYVGLDENHTESYHYFMFENLFNHIDEIGRASCRERVYHPV